MEKTSTDSIVASLTKAIAEQRLMPGAKLVEQKLADHFKVSRTMVRQALFQLSQNRLVRLEVARGAFVATPSVEEARQVYAVRRTLEVQLMRDLANRITPGEIELMRAHVQAEREATKLSGNLLQRTDLLGDFHVELAKISKNELLAELLTDLISRCALITLMYQSRSAAQHSTNDHEDILNALANKDADTAASLMLLHLREVESSLVYDRKVATEDISTALI